MLPHTRTNRSLTHALKHKRIRTGAHGTQPTGAGLSGGRKISGLQGIAKYAKRTAARGYSTMLHPTHSKRAILPSMGGDGRRDGSVYAEVKRRRAVLVAQNILGASSSAAKSNRVMSLRETRKYHADGQSSG